MSKRIQRIERTEYLTVAAADPFVVTLWHDALTAERMQNLSLLYRKVNRSLGDFVSLLVLEEGARLPGSETKDVAAAMLAEDQDRIKGVGMVIESSGFRAAGLRSAISTLGFIVRTPYPLRAFDTVAAAAAWGTGILEGMTAAELESAIATLRR